MATVDLEPIPFSDLDQLAINSEAVCYAMLGSKTSAMTRQNSPYWKCVFKDRKSNRTIMVWSNDELFPEAEHWADGEIYLIHVIAKAGKQSQIDFKLKSVRPIGPEDEGRFVAADLMEYSRFTPDDCVERIRKLVQEKVIDPKIASLIQLILEENEELVKKMPAAAKMHHAYPGGLIEHMWSITRVALMLAQHYAKYYNDLDPPINQDIIVAAAIMHDIGKLKELEFHPSNAEYTVVGLLVGHIVIGRDMVRAAAAKVDNFPAETLLLLEHAILAHHGKLEFASPVIPLTIEALIVSYADDLDSKVNAFAQARLKSTNADPFTDYIFFSPDRRRVYKGVSAVENPRETDSEP